MTCYARRQCLSRGLMGRTTLIRDSDGVSSQVLHGERGEFWGVGVRDPMAQRCGRMVRASPALAMASPGPEGRIIELSEEAVYYSSNRYAANGDIR